ncbi:ABC transporter ATP-binding protein [Methanonatronarchaeum sp. AMET6-2]|uniref:ABC transporter ATP-binding protein n=1 Tax=Methanonatronarchaeum sp. AMET6-2 TaxID=2933293 RepID=UPI0012213771|nr:ATP-binding cassette domain-containing protein [Methanonatronarchaeum sp. AMET6-2]RZN62449.1 MAG: ATP-binding cassette domain-containing protein [Methanonatronarchaeia archaeon]UOY09694.1 ATP-binding cassette domain-containing protein [Methanonatronarchaeum sp. AMET6-2]
MITVENLFFSYGDGVDTLKEIDFSVDSEEFFGIIGPNGSGKTTLLKCVSGVLEPYKGSVLINGKDVSDLSRSEIAKEVAVVPQQVRIGFDFSVEEVVQMGRIAHQSFLSADYNDGSEAVESALEMTGASSLRGRNASSLSGGELQRVIISRAIAQDTDTILLDEPTSHLDINHQIEVVSLAKELSKRKCIVGIFHDLNIAAQFCDRLLLLNEGEVRCIGKPRDVLTSRNIKDTYGINVVVKEHPLTGSIYVTPFSESKEIEVSENGGTRIHVICGGGSGNKLLYDLKREGYNISTGVLNNLDSDKEVAESIDIPIVSEAPFSEITEETYKQNLEFIDSADIVVISELSVGQGNLKNLLAAEKALEKGKTVIAISSIPIEKRDYTDGKGAEVYSSLKEKGLVEVEDINQLFKFIESIETKITEKCS